MKKGFRVVKNFKIVQRSCSLNRYYRVVTYIKNTYFFKSKPSFLPNTVG